MKSYVVITGASSGIGYEAAKLFAEMGKNLILIARRTDQMEALKQEILKSHSDLDIVCISKDLSNPTNVYQLYEEVKKYSVEVWINNAGFGYFGLIGEQDLEKIEEMLRLNIEALTVLSSLYTRDYFDVEGAQLINISSAAGYSIVPKSVTYSATKFYVSAFTEGLAWELKNRGAKMRAKILAPAATQTEFAQIANQVDHFDYDKVFGTYHTSREMAEFLLEVYRSDQTLGAVNRDTFEFKLSDGMMIHAGKAAQK